MSDSVKLSRKQYDQLIGAAPEWMATEYLKLERQWSISGVRCRGTEAMLVELRGRVSALETGE